jgi:mannose-1-phosphate guanylyltransferase/mannose-6-phosphate isomerase
MASSIIPVIMCGGAVSRESMPKQFVPLIGTQSTFQQVLGRIADHDLFARPIVITRSDFRFVAAEQLRDRGIEADIVLEPMPRDSGPAVAVAATLAVERAPDALVLVLAADHVMAKPDAFREACRGAAAAAAEGRIVTFGIEPTGAVTSYGYIRPGDNLNGGQARAVSAFVEKPDAATAGRYVADGYFWNSGNFLFHAATMLQESDDGVLKSEYTFDGIHFNRRAYEIWTGRLMRVAGLSARSASRQE